MSNAFQNNGTKNKETLILNKANLERYASHMNSQVIFRFLSMIREVKFSIQSQLHAICVAPCKATDGFPLRGHNWVHFAHRL